MTNGKTKYILKIINNGKERIMIWFGKENIEEIDSCREYSEISGQASKLNAIGLDIVKKSATLRALLRAALNYKKRRQYIKRTKGVKTDSKVILFSTFDGRSYADSPKAIYEYMLSNPEFDDYTFIWALRAPAKHKELLYNKNTYIVQPSTPQYDIACKRAKYWFFNFRIADYIFPDENQVYVQLWHGTPLKKLGYDINKSNNAMNSQKEIRAKYRIDAKKFSYILAPSDFAKERFVSAWNLKAMGKEDSVLVEGYPRNDSLINHTIDDIKTEKECLKLPENKKIILYAPTWRDNQHSSELGYTYTPEIDFDKLKAELSEEYIILFRAHYLVANSFDFDKYKGFVYDVSWVEDVNSLYIISDLLITDYSSVFFDYANLKRPIIFYMYDYESYANETRGFYIKPEELPGVIAKTSEELIKEIKAVDYKNFDFDKQYPNFAEKFNPLDDGQAAKRVADIIIKK